MPHRPARQAGRSAAGLPGRFDIHIHIGLPDATARRAILEVHARGQPLAGDVDLAAISAETEGCSGADLAGICREAIRRLIRQTPGDDHDMSRLLITREDRYTALARNINRSSTDADVAWLAGAMASGAEARSRGRVGDREGRGS